MVGTPFRLTIASIILLLVAGCARPAEPGSVPLKIRAMISTLDSLQAEKAKEGNLVESRWYVSIAPTRKNTIISHSAGDDSTGFASYDIVFSDETLKGATVASLTEVVLNSDKRQVSAMTLYVWEQNRWLSEIDCIKSHFPKVQTELEKAYRKSMSTWQPTSEPLIGTSGPASKP